MIETAAKIIASILALSAFACFVNMAIRQLIMIEAYRDEREAANAAGAKKGWHFLTSPADQAAAAKLFGDDKFAEKRRKLSQAWAWLFVSFFLLFSWVLVCGVTGIIPMESFSKGA